MVQDQLSLFVKMGHSQIALDLTLCFMLLWVKNLEGTPAELEVLHFIPALGSQKPLL